MYEREYGWCTKALLSSYKSVHTHNNGKLENYLLFPFFWRESVTASGVLLPDEFCKRHKAATAYCCKIQNILYTRNYGRQLLLAVLNFCCLPFVKNFTKVIPHRVWWQHLPLTWNRQREWVSGREKERDACSLPVSTYLCIKMHTV